MPVTPSGIEPAIFRFVAQHLNHCATAVPLSNRVSSFIRRLYEVYYFYGFFVYHIPSRSFGSIFFIVVYMVVRFVRFCLIL